MSPRTVLAAALAAILIVAMPMQGGVAQTSKQETGKDTQPGAKEPAAETKKKPSRKEMAAEKKAKAAEKKAKASAAQKAARERQKQCGAEWRKLRADGKVEKGMTWPKYYSACNKRLKEKAA